MKIRGKSAFKPCASCGNEFEYEVSRKTLYCSYTCSAHKKQKPREPTTKYIERASLIHNAKYDYSKVDLLSRTKDIIEIICPNHGSFFQLLNQHLLGKGCKKCALEKGKKPVEEFMNEAIMIHGNKYDYSLVDYINCYTHVEIICPIHGVFKQTPSQHICNKAGCSQCKKNIRISKAEKEWLDFHNIPNDYRQYYIGKKNDQEPYFIVDGISVDYNTVYEFLGDYWHGNPEIYDANDYNKSCKKTFGKLYNETMDRFERLRNLGYKIEYIWESKWLKEKI